jgi:TolA-binding protein
MKSRKLFFAGILLLCMGGCSSERNTFINRAFHNLTSHYNAFYLTESKIAKVEDQILTNYKEDYTQLLPVIIAYDSSSVQQHKASLDSARALASKAIDWHRISKWVDDSYYLIGKIDYLQGRSDDAKNTFRYVNSQSKDKDLRHQALISLLQLYIDQNALEDANFTIDYLSKETEINPTNRHELFKTLAYYYESKSDQNGVIGALDRAITYSKDKKERSRMYFMLAQRYQSEGLDALAYDYYQKSLEGNPPYERSFFATLYSQQVAELNASKDVKKVRNYYDGLYEDPKNKELKDVVVYERALFEEKQGDIPLALELLQKAAKEQGSLPRIKGYIYEKLAKIQLDQFKNYRASKYYLDSALNFITEEDEEALALREQKQTLDTYVFHFERIQTTDSLLQLSNLTPEEQRMRAEAFLENEKAKLEEQALKEKTSTSASLFDNLLAFGDRGNASSFYFDNSTAMQQGAIDFVRTWGNRTLQDNWRRKAALFETSTQATTPLDVNDNPKQADSLANAGLPSVESLLASIPASPEQIQAANQEVETSYFELGKLLYINLKEPELSAQYLEKFINNFPKSIKKPEAYYLLYLGQKEVQGRPDYYVTLLNSEFPESPYTFSVNNPEATSGNLAYLESAKGYEQAYDAYYAGNYSEAKSLIFSTLEKFPLTRNTEKLLLLNVMIAGKLESRTNYRVKLEEFIQLGKEPALVELAKSMLLPLLSQEELDQRAQANQAAPANDTPIKEAIVEKEAISPVENSPYKISNDQTHIFILVLSQSEAESAKNLLGDLETFHSQSFGEARLRTGNMSMSQELTFYIISPFSTAEKAMDYFTTFKNKFSSTELSEEAKSKAFFISIENFQVLNKTKNVEEYLNFFTSTYH